MTFLLKYSLIITVASFALLGCLEEVESSYQLPRKVTLSTNFIVDPLFVGEILDHPIKHGNIWNDSLVKLSNFKELEINCKGGKSPDATSEKSLYLFNQKGQIKKYENFDFEQGEDPYSIIRFNYTNKNVENVIVDLYFGENDTIEINKFNDQTTDVLVRKDKSALNDSIFVYHPIQNTKVIVEKIGSKISVIQVVTPKNTSIKQAQEIVYGLGITEEDLNYAERKITYTRTGLPLTTYELSREWRQLEAIEKWEYFEDRVIVNYKRYVNHTLVRDFNFTYSDDLVLRTIEQDGKIFEFNYR